MFWRQTESVRANPLPRPGAPVGSITRRLMVLYVTSTATLLVLVVGFLDRTIATRLDQTRPGTLAGKVEELRHLLREQPAHPELLGVAVERETDAGQPIRYYLRILDGQGRQLLATPGMDRLGLTAAFPPPVASTDPLPRSIGEHLRRHGAFLLLSAQVPVGTAGREHRTLQLAMDASTGNTVRRDDRSGLLVVLGLGLALTALAGGWVVRAGMRPLAEITRAARRITASQLHEPIGRTQWPVELAELAAAFDGMLDRLEDSFARLSQFSADLAHALRTPLHNLRGEAEVALARERTPAEYQHILASSLEECDRLSRMIDGLLFLARADDPQAILTRTRFGVRREIDAVIEFYEALASEQQVTVTGEGEAWLTGDPMLFRRAVSNLLGNALRYTAAGGTIRISAGLGPDQRVEIQVRDTGSGIAPEHLDRIFDRFYRVGQSSSPVPGGIGLGLAIVRSIMRLHGGTAAALSVVGEGSTLTLTFPAEIAASPSTKMTRL